MRKFRLKLNCLLSCSFVELTQYLQLRNYANVQAAEETVCFTYPICVDCTHVDFEAGNEDFRGRCSLVS